MPDIVHQAGGDHLSRLQPHVVDVVAEIRRRSAEDAIPVASADTAHVLYVLTRAVNARRVFEIGTGYGVSGLSIALAAGPESLLFTVERDQARAALARGHFERAGVGGRVNVMSGEATRLVHKVAGPFDLIVQDGDKAQYEPLLDRLVGLLRPGGMLVSIAATARYNDCLAADSRLTTMFLAVGDGMAVSVKLEGQP